MKTKFFHLSWIAVIAIHFLFFSYNSSATEILSRVLDTNVRYSSPYKQSNPNVAFDGKNYFVVWEEESRCGGWWDVYGARISPDGKLVDSASILISTYSECPDVCFDGKNFLVTYAVWKKGYSDIYCTRVSPDGVVLDPNGIPICVSETNKAHPHVAFNGKIYLVAWQDYRNGKDYDIYAARVTSDGVVLDPNGFALTTAPFDQMHSHLASDSNLFFVLWRDRRNSNDFDIYATFVDDDGNVLNPEGLPICTLPGDQARPRPVFLGNKYFIVWRSKTENDFNIEGNFVDLNGKPLLENPFPICSYEGDQIHPSAAFDGKNLLVVWDDYRNGENAIYATRIDTLGNVLEPNGFLISQMDKNFREYPVVAFDGQNYFAFWHDSWTGNSDILGVRINTEGKILDSVFTNITFSGNKQVTPVADYISGNGTLLAVWSDYLSEHSSIVGTRINPVEPYNLLDSRPFVIHTGKTDQQNPAIAGNGNVFLVVWEDYKEGESDILAKRVSTDGIVLDSQPVVVSNDEKLQGKPSVLFDGENFLVVWEDTRNGTFDIFGRRVSPEGEVIDSISQPLIVLEKDQRKTKIAKNGAANLVVWEEAVTSYEFDILGARFTNDWVLLDTTPIAISKLFGYQLSPVVCSDGENFYVVWVDFRRGTAQLFGTIITSNGENLYPNGIQLTSTPFHEINPSIHYANGMIFLSWEELTDLQAPQEIKVYFGIASINPFSLRKIFLINSTKGCSVSSSITSTETDAFVFYSKWIDNISNKPVLNTRIVCDVVRNPSSVEVICNNDDEIAIFPNPFENSVTISVGIGVAGTFEIFDFLGQKVFSYETENGTFEWNGTDMNSNSLPQGIYIVVFRTNDKYISKIFAKIK